MSWFADLLICWWVGLLICWYADMLICWFADELICWFADLMMSWFADVVMCWFADVLMNWCACLLQAGWFENVLIWLHTNWRSKSHSQFAPFAAAASNNHLRNFSFNYQLSCCCIFDLFHWYTRSSFEKFESLWGDIEHTQLGYYFFNTFNTCQRQGAFRQ